MPWVTTKSSTLPSQIVAAGTDNTPPSGAISVPMEIAVQAVCNPSLFVLNSTEVEKTDMKGETYTATEYSLTAAPLSLQQAKTIQAALVRQNFQNTANAPVTDSSGNVWDGGFGSALKLNGVVQIAQQMKQTSVTIYDASNNAHTMTIAEVQAVTALVAEAYQTAFAKKQAALVAINAAQTVADIESMS